MPAPDPAHDPAEFVLPPADPDRSSSHRSVAARPARRGCCDRPAPSPCSSRSSSCSSSSAGTTPSSTASSTGSSVAGDDSSDGTTDGSEAADQVATDDTDLAPLEPYDGLVNPASVGRPYSDKVDGLISFRGNPTRTYYGKGPVPTAPLP